MKPDDILNTLKAIFSTFSMSIKYLRSRKCEKVIEKFLDQFEKLNKNMSFSENKETFLNLLISIIQTINSVFKSNICQ